MNSSQYKKCQLKYLCSQIGCKPAEVEYISIHIDDYYKEWTEKKLDKITGDFKRYKDGTLKQRIIRPSLNRLKSIQRTIKKKILEPITLPENIKGGVKGGSNIANAKPHQGNKFQFTTDLQNYFPSIKYKRVYDTFVSLGFSHHIAHWLTLLTTWKYELPQGTPTSTHIANLVFLDTDKELIVFCKKHGITYTRYVDDLTFSSQQDFKQILNEILQIILRSGFKISYRKTKYSGGQIITGIQVFNNYIDAPPAVKEKAFAELKSSSITKPYSNYLNNIRKTNKTINKKHRIHSK